MTRKIDIKGYNGKYYITDQGEVFRRYKNHDRKLRSYKKRRLYAIGLTGADGKKKMRTINSLMKEHFFNCTDPNYGMYHKNGMQEDCAVANLKLMHKKELGKLTGAQSSRKAVLEICEYTGDVLKVYSSAREAGRCKYVSGQAITDWCNGKYRQSILPGVKFMWDEDFKY